MRRTMVTRVFEATKAIALCHNVTPIVEKQPFVIQLRLILLHSKLSNYTLLTRWRQKSVTKPPVRTKLPLFRGQKVLDLP